MCAIGIERRFVPLVTSAVYSGLSITSLRRLARSGRLTPHRPVGRNILLDVRQLDQLVQDSSAVANHSTQEGTVS
jgi:hypothetical protein